MYLFKKLLLNPSAHDYNITTTVHFGIGVFIIFLCTHNYLEKGSTENAVMSLPPLLTSSHFQFRGFSLVLNMSAIFIHLL